MQADTGSRLVIKHNAEIICLSEETVNSWKTDGILVTAEYIFQVGVVQEASHIDPSRLMATLILLDRRDMKQTHTQLIFR